MKEFWNGAARIEPEDVITQAIQDAPDYYDGQLEAMRRQIDKMSAIIGAIVARLPQDVGESIASDFVHGCGFRVVEKKTGEPNEK